MTPMPSRIGRLGMVLAVLALAGLAPSRGSAQPIEHPKLTLSIGTFIISYLPLPVAEAKGFFKAQGLDVTIQNFGASGAKALQSLIGGSSDVVVGFYEGDPQQGGTLLGTAMTTKILYPAEAQEVVLELPEIPASFMDGSQPLVIVVDDGMPDHPWHECRTDNNTVTIGPACKAIG